MSHIQTEKANWTPSYHKIFVDLCLDETLKGNKPGTHFTKEGWQNIVESFYEKTGSRYDMKQMKNHWSLTKLQWKIWFKLIGDSSMKWDPETKKLGATKEDWAHYIKANPEAAQFQFMELQNTDKLEIILNGTINGAWIHVSTGYKRKNCCLISSPLYVKEEAITTPTVKEEHLPDDELRSAVMAQSTQGIPVASEQSMSISSPSNAKAIWTPVIHKIFIDLCLEQKLKGNKPGTRFTKEGWRTIFGSFQKKTGLSYETLQLKNHWNVTKERWKVWSNLIGTPSMKWDPNTNKFGASEENWEEYLQANPAASQFRFKALELADKLETIFYGSTVTAETEPTSRRRKYNNASTMPHLSNREPEIPKPDEKTERFCDAVESRGALMIQKEAQFVQSRGGKLSYSIGECIDCLDGMEEVEPGSDLYLFALDIFLKKEYREVFLQLKNPSVRMAWLQRLQSLGPSL
ncbi:L10-interacting MYB domain-containing protein [Juglans microcarpa x Juglans regia]|uniref:L10-interacting MYB domain-containing protein n=1 Tax=Juglans microcarpa x Juglans regia TaxID=2249226 RepID=UPI001B7DA82F|nr:L10-interacting MYB domain-containing protein [Juglans microcarpa x Juglans regia]XP_041000493.1 L10-interacting MYB domain-containing protein [Juglans microcarpa x Juglans regia]